MYSAQSLGLSVQGYSNHQQLIVCPFHHDNNASAWFLERKGLFYCSVCGIGYNIHQLAKRLEIDLDDIEEDHEQELPDFNLLNDNQQIDYGEPFFHPYFGERGISRAIALEYGITWKMGNPQAAVLPITDVYGKRVGACYRFLNVQEAGTRYKIVGEPTPLWPMHLVKQGWSKDSKGLIVTEGAFSAMRIASCLDSLGCQGNIVALLGAKANESIVTALRPFEAFVLYDNDFAGRRACKKLRELHPTVHAWTLNKAPDDMSDDEIYQLLDRMGKKLNG